MILLLLAEIDGLRVGNVRVAVADPLEVLLNMSEVRLLLLHAYESLRSRRGSLPQSTESAPGSSVRAHGGDAAEGSHPWGVTSASRRLGGGMIA